MTAPAPPPGTEPVPPEEPVPAEPVDPAAAAEVAAIEEDVSVLIPLLVSLFAAYVAWKAAGAPAKMTWRTLVVSLKISDRVGGALGMIAQRALARQRDRAGADGNDLLRFADQAVRAGVDGGVRTIAEAIAYLDRETTTPEPRTRDSAPPAPAPFAGPRSGADDTRPAGPPELQDRGGPTIPTAADPPVDLALMTAVATKNLAQLTAAQLAGWATKEWQSVGDKRVRPMHDALDDPAYRWHRVPVGDLFEQPDGVVLRVPGDPLAPIGARINCRCWVTYQRGGVKGLLDKVTGNQPSA